MLRPRDGPIVGRLFASQHPENGGLARSIGTDQASLIAGGELERSVDKKRLLAIELTYVGQRYHAYVLPQVAGKIGGEKSR